MGEVDLNDLKLNLPEHKPVVKGKKSPAKRWIFAFIILAVLVFAGFLLYRHYTQTQVPVVGIALVIEEQTEEGSITFSAGGWLESVFPWPITVSSLISGRIEKLLVYEGVPVKKGQVLAEFYKKDLEDNLKKAEAELAVNQANLRRLEAGYRSEEVAQAKAEYERCLALEELKKQIFERSESLLETGAISKEQLEKDESEYKIAQANREKAQQNYELLKSGYRQEDIEVARAEVARAKSLRVLAQSQLAYAEITAPVDGKILEMFVNQGSYVTAEKSKIVSVYDPNQIQIRVDVRQSDRTKVKLGQRVEVTTDARPDKSYQGTVIRIDPLANLAKDTIQVKIQVKDPDDFLHPEMTATINFLEGTDSEVSSTTSNQATPRLLIPRSAVIMEGDKQFVFVMRNSKAYRIPVVTGGTVMDKVEVISGLNRGERVIISNLDKLNDGDKVTIKR